MPAIPSNYDQVTINIHLDELNTAATTVIDQCTIINDHLTVINKTLSDLRLAWTGAASDNAQQVNASWNNLMAWLYGSANDPDAGILNILSSGLYAVVQNFAYNDEDIASMFTKFPDPNVQNGPSPDPNKPLPGNDQGFVDGTYSQPPYHDTAVNETF